MLKPLGDRHSVLGLCVRRAQKSKEAQEVVVVTTSEPEDFLIIDEANRLGVRSFRGSDTDVLGRYFNAAKDFNADIVVRVTSDCPFIDPELIDQSIRHLKLSSADYYCNQEPFLYPDGMDVDVFTFEILEKAFNEASSNYDREHVTPYMKKIAKKAPHVQMAENFSSIRLTVDEPEDLEMSRLLYSKLENPEEASWVQIVEILSRETHISQINAHILSNEGAKLTAGEKLYRRAKRVIPGGNMLLSKRPEMFLQSGWPSYYSKALGCEIWDLDDKKYLDMSIMGIGTNILGYAYEPVDSAVKSCIEKSTMSTFNCPEEVFLAEKLIELHPWAENVKFARTGGEVNAMAVRIARAATGKNHVVICGYHGWHDWYLAANLSSSTNLDDHLLPGLDPAGVPKELSGLTHAIRYNSFEDLDLLDSNPDIGVLIMEVMRSTEPAVGYLEAIREKCNKNGIVLIFDECTSGFRETYGGLHLKFGVTPDLATFGKALGNGYAITALIGKSNVMTSVENTFMSSTFWSERTGYVAALASLKAMANLRSWEKITQIGLKMRNIWSESFTDTGIDFSFSGIPALSALQFHGPNGNVIKTLITQEMLKEKILASNIFYPSIAHTEIHLEQYRSALQEVILKITKTSDPRTLLHSEPSQMGFKRLN